MSSREPDDDRPTHDSAAGRGDRPPRRDPEPPDDVWFGSDEARVDDLFGALAHRDRRHVLGYLYASAGDVAPFDDLCAHLEAVSSESRGAIRTRLHHTDLPVLDAAGLVDYDPATGVVVSRPNELASELLGTVEERTEFTYEPSDDTDG